MEVGVCVEAYRQEAEKQRRHINSAFMTFVVLDKDDQPQKLPWIRPQPGVSASSPTLLSCHAQQPHPWLFFGGATKSECPALPARTGTYRGVWLMLAVHGPE